MKSLKIWLFFLFSLFLGMNSFQVSFADQNSLKKIEGPDPKTTMQNIVNETNKKNKEKHEKQAKDSMDKMSWKKKEECKGIKLNTDVPFVGKCIGYGKDASNKSNQLDAFPKLVAGLMKLVITTIMVMSLLMVVAAGVMISSSGGSTERYNKGIAIIEKVAIGIALLGASGVILKIINPNFFV